MSSQSDSREVIPGGRQQFGWEHLIPVAKLLIERGHLPIRSDSKFGFHPSSGRTMCSLARRFTEEDWDAINQRFILPDTIVYFHGLIRDNVNRVDMMGREEVTFPDGVQPIDVWEARERAAGRQF